MQQQIFNSVAATVLFAFATSLQAASVTLNFAGGDLIPDGSFDVSLDLDFADAPGFDPGAFGGGVVLSFDAGQISLDGFAPSGAATIVDLLPTVPTVDCTAATVVCFVDAPAVATVGTFTFTVNPALAPPAPIMIGIADADDGFGSFAETLSDQAFNPDFIGVTVTAVPLPATAWFIASGLAVFGLRVRKRC